MDQTTKQSVIDRLKQANSVLVTVKNSPTVDELAACIGFTLFLNKAGKHATAVFSGDIPSTIEFLEPEETLEKNTDSLRDFIIALDKSKADKLRYKVEDKVVKIFITPYKTSLGEEDLDFSQGDFNVDVVVALGAHTKEDLDKAIVAHGRILHDATIITMTNSQASSLGTLNLLDPKASSICEMAVDISETLQPNKFDTQMATALLTGIVAETARFSNKKTTPQTMTLSAKLMSAGANQQLIATKLQPEMVAGGQSLNASSPAKDVTEEDGTLKIAHNPSEEEQKEAIPEEPVELPEAQEEDVSPPEDEELPYVPEQQPEGPKISSARTSNEAADSNESTPAGSPPDMPSNMAFTPPQMGGTLTANSQREQYSPTTDPLSNTQAGKTLTHGQSPINRPKPEDFKDSTLKDIETKVNNYGEKTLDDIEQSVDSKHQEHIGDTPPPIDSARQAVEEAAQDSPDQPSPLQAVGSQPVDLGNQPSPTTEASQPQNSGNQNSSMPDFLPDDKEPPASDVTPAPPPTPLDGPGSSQASPPPPVPPPMMPPAQ